MTLSLKGVFGETDGRTGTVDISVDERTLTVTMLGADALLCVRRVVSVPVSAVRNISVVARDDIPHARVEERLGQSVRRHSAKPRAGRPTGRQHHESNSIQSKRCDVRRV